MGKPLTCECLIRMGGDIHRKDGERMTPLHRAVQQCGVTHIDIALLLLRRGAEIEYTAESEDSTDMGKLIRGARGHAKKFVHPLIESGAKDGGLVPLLFCKKMGSKGDALFHTAICTSEGKVWSDAWWHAHYSLMT